MDAHALEAQPLFEALRDLLLAYRDCTARSEELVGALASADFARVHAAVAAQMAALSVVEGAERRRQAAARAIACALKGRDPLASGSPGTVTTTALLQLLPPDEASELAATRHEMLGTLVALQRLQRQAAVLARTGQAALRHAAYRAGGGAIEGYGPRGERPGPRQESTRRQERWA